MSEIVYRILSLLSCLLACVPLGTNLGLLHLLWALLCGRLLASRGALFPALAALGLSDAAVRRAAAALCYGDCNTDDLVNAWHKRVLAEGGFVPHCYEGVCPVACDLSGFFRPRLQSPPGKHYTSVANKALPAVVLGLVASVGSVGRMRLALPRLLLRGQAGESETGLKKRLLARLKALLAPGEAALLDAGFEIAEVLEANLSGFVVRAASNRTARRNFLPAYPGKGRPAEYGEIVRPLARQRNGKTRAATPPDSTARWKDGAIQLRAPLYNHLVLPTAQPGSASFRCVVIFDPRYQDPLVLVTNLKVTAYALWRLYRDRWPIEQLPLAVKQMLGAERAFVFGQQSRFRLPELARLAGNLLSYVAACSQPLATGFWDRCARPTCGRLRRALARLDFAQLPFPEAQFRKKASVTGHLPKGVAAHRRKKAALNQQAVPKAA